MHSTQRESDDTCNGRLFAHLPDAAIVAKWRAFGVTESSLWISMLRARSYEDLLDAGKPFDISATDVWALEHALRETLNDPTFAFAQRAIRLPIQDRSPPDVPAPSVQRQTSQKARPKTDDMRRMKLDGVTESDEAFDGGLWKLSVEATAFLAAAAEVKGLTSSCIYKVPCFPVMVMQSHSLCGGKICRVLIWDTARHVAYYHRRKQHIEKLVCVLCTTVPNILDDLGESPRLVLCERMVNAAGRMHKVAGARDGVLMTRPDDEHAEYAAWMRAQCNEDVAVHTLKQYVHGEGKAAFPAKVNQQLGPTYDAIMSGTRVPQLLDRCKKALASACVSEVKWIFSALQFPSETSMEGGTPSGCVPENANTEESEVEHTSPPVSTPESEDDQTKDRSPGTGGGDMGLGNLLMQDAKSRATNPPPVRQFTGEAHEDDEWDEHQDAIDKRAANSKGGKKGNKSKPKRTPVTLTWPCCLFSHGCPGQGQSGPATEPPAKRRKTQAPKSAPPATTENFALKAGIQGLAQGSSGAAPGLPAGDACIEWCGLIA